MVAKALIFNAAAQRKLLRGIHRLADAVRVTLGPGGRTVVLDRGTGSPRVTKDGVTVAKEIEFHDRFENAGAQMLREVAARTQDTAGDGTTTAIVLAQAICREGMRLVAAGVAPSRLKEGIEAASRAAIDELGKGSLALESERAILQVGTISANGDAAIGQILADAIAKVGKTGVITIEEGKGLTTTLELVEGMEFGRGYLSPFFVSDEARKRCVLERPYILLSRPHLSAMRDMVELLATVAEEHTPLLVIAEDVDGEALATLVVNRLQGVLESAAVRGPSFGEYRKDSMRDLAVLTGATVIGDEAGVRLADVELRHLGRAERVEIYENRTRIIGGKGNPTALRGWVETLGRTLQDATKEADRERLSDRIAKLSNGVAVIRVGAASETEMKEKKDRVEDAMHATRSAALSGVVPGGGVALLRCQTSLDALPFEDEEVLAGVRVVRRALEEPLRRIAENAGKEASLVVSRVRARSGSFGYDAEKDEYGDLFEAGVLDATRVVQSALENACSIAALILTTEAVLVSADPEGLPEVMEEYEDV